MVEGFIVRRIDVVITLPLSYCLFVVRTISRRGRSYEELEDLPQYESDCELPSNNNNTDEDSDFVIDVPESQKSSSNSDETTPPLSTLTRRNSNTDIASTSSCVQPIRSFRGISRGTSKSRGRSGGNRGRRLEHDKESERVEEIGSDGTIWKILDPNHTFAGLEASDGRPTHINKLYDFGIYILLSVSAYKRVFAMPRSVASIKNRNKAAKARKSFWKRRKVIDLIETTADNVPENTHVEYFNK
ncbi:hypothetical protein FQA39_LY05428 [Lamprigera yunnana]|nr:hypothetical protein FQA39_LY05428 [Lamprigera yunnana]